MTHIHHSQKPPQLVTILGPTATGKTALAVALAEVFGGEVISVDSRQVYRGMDIGTGKDLAEYDNVPYHLIDIADPGEEYHLFRFVQDFNQTFHTLSAHHILPFAVGGTGMYLDALLNRYKLTESRSAPELNDLSDNALREKLVALRPYQHNTTDTEDRKRLLAALAIAMAENAGAPCIQASECRHLTLGVQFPRAITRERITLRLKQRLKEGMIEEVEALHAQGLSWNQLDFYGLEYRFIAQHLQGKLNANDLFQKLNAAIHQFAKQQEKWFRNIEKKGHPIRWLDMEKDLVEQAERHIHAFLD